MCFKNVACYLLEYNFGEVICMRKVISLLLIVSILFTCAIASAQEPIKNKNVSSEILMKDSQGNDIRIEVVERGNQTTLKHYDSQGQLVETAKLTRGSSVVQMNNKEKGKYFFDTSDYFSAKKSYDEAKAKNEIEILSS